MFTPSRCLSAYPNAELPPGACIERTFLSAVPQEEIFLQIYADAEPWTKVTSRHKPPTASAREVKQYGKCRFNYNTGRIDPAQPASQPPPYLMQLADQLVQEGWVPERPDHFIVNKYEPDKVQCIRKHIDSPRDFAEHITTISIGGIATCIFREVVTGTKVSVMLEAGNLLLISGRSRYEWTHEVSPVQGQTRISITFRRLCLSNS